MYRPRGHGYIEMVVGPMYSGKSEELIRRLTRAKIAKQDVIVFKPSIDDRYSAADVVSHSGIALQAVAVNKLDTIWDFITEDTQVAGFDEVQFFNLDLIEVIDTLIRYCDVDVVCAGLAQDSSGKPFGIMPRLLCMADKITSLTAVCSKCKEIGKATRTFRKVEGGKQVEVGGADKYEARCLPCWSFDQ